MKTKPDELNKRIKKFHEGLKQAGMKLTHQRLEIFKELASSEEHPDAETIYHRIRKRLTTISLDTVYRTLWTFRDLGLIESLGLRNENIRFDANTSNHHHFVCTNCGITRDFYCDEYDHIALPMQVLEFGEVKRTQVELKGLCYKCINEQKLSVKLKGDNNEKETHH